MPKSDYIEALDGVRALAIVPVLALHGSYGHVEGGFLGVDLFFVLSGYLITTLIIREQVMTGRLHIGYFYLRRCLRILPPLVLATLLATMLGGFDWRTGGLPIIFFYANTVDFKLLGSLSPTWSLSTEEQFYFVWPVLIWCTARLSRPSPLALAIAIFVAAALLRCGLYASGHVAADILAMVRPDAIAAGCVAALVPRGVGAASFRLQDSSVALYVGAYAILVLVAPARSPLMLTVGYAGFAIASARFVRAAATLADHSLAYWLLTHTAMRYLGRRSYGIYLYHMPIFLALEPLREPGSSMNFALVTMLRVIATLGVAHLSFRYVEAPILALRHRVTPVHTQTAGSATGANVFARSGTAH